MTSDFSLAGQAALVTGGSRGIGRSVALGLARAGAAVAVASRKADACEAVVAEIRAAGGTAVSCPGHVGRADEVEAIVAAAIAGLGRLDVLVNNAATNPVFAPLVDVDEASFDKTFAVNLKGPWQATRAAVRGWMGDHGGSVINVASIGGIRGEALMGAYNASKAALISLTQTLAFELAGSGVRVNAVAPGLIRTDFARLLVETDALREHVLAQTALHRVGEPDEIAGAVVYLASKASSYTTGSVLVVDGGALA